MPDGARPALYGMRKQMMNAERGMMSDELKNLCLYFIIHHSAFIIAFLLSTLELKSFLDGRGWPLSLDRCLDGGWLA